MPHSSGGGSSGGGSHGGSHGSSSGGSGRRSRLSNHYFPGARRYMYYEGNNVHFAYSNYNLSGPSKLRFLVLIFYIPFIIAILSMVFSSVFIPEKLDNPDGEIRIIDNTRDIRDTERLEQSLYKFYEATGVTPAVITLYDSDWSMDFGSLEQCAYNTYIRQFDDEMHWLIVYSRPKKSEGDPESWSWEGMIGDDTGKSVSSAMCDKLTSALQGYLYSYPVEDAVAMAFDDALRARKTSVSLKNLAFVVPTALFVIFHALGMLGVFSKTEYHKDAVPVDDDAEITICSYCGGTYLTSERTCPHCGGSEYEGPEIGAARSYENEYQGPEIR